MLATSDGGAAHRGLQRYTNFTYPGLPVRFQHPRKILQMSGNLITNALRQRCRQGRNKNEDGMHKFIGCRFEIERHGGGPLAIGLFGDTQLTDGFRPLQFIAGWLGFGMAYFFTLFWT